MHLNFLPIKYTRLRIVTSLPSAILTIFIECVLDDQDIVEFLADEIAAEKSNQKNLELPGSGFELKTEGAEVTFSKSLGSEK